MKAYKHTASSAWKMHLVEQMWIFHVSFEEALQNSACFPIMRVGVRIFFFSGALSDSSGYQSSGPEHVWTPAPCAASERSRFPAPPCKDCKFWAMLSQECSRKNNFSNIRISRSQSPSAQFYWHLDLSASSKKVWCCTWGWQKCFTIGTSAGAVHRWLFCHMEQSFTPLSVRQWHPCLTWITKMNWK